MLAVTLSRTDFREFDQVIALYTLSHGKVEVVARGIKKNIAKNAPALEPFSLIDIELAPGRELTYLIKATVIEPYVHIRSNLSALAAGATALALMQQLVGVGERDAVLFELIVDFLRCLNKANDSGAILFMGFMVRLLAVLGLVPTLDRCVHCGKTRRVTKQYVFAVDMGGLLCRTCRELKLSVMLVPVSGQALELMELLGRLEWKRMTTLTVDVKVQKTVEKLLKNFTEYHTNRPMPFSVLTKLAVT